MAYLNDDNFVVGIMGFIRSLILSSCIVCIAECIPTSKSELFDNTRDTRILKFEVASPIPVVEPRNATLSARVVQCGTELVLAL